MPRSRAWLRASQRNWQPETDTRRKTSLPSLSPSAISIIHTDFKFLEENFLGSWYLVPIYNLLLSNFLKTIILISFPNAISLYVDGYGKSFNEIASHLFLSEMERISFLKISYLDSKFSQKSIIRRPRSTRWR